MKKTRLKTLPVAIILALSLIFSGCATTIPTPSVKTIQMEQYQDLELNDNGIVYKIPTFVGDLSLKGWKASDYQYSVDLFGILLSKDGVHVSMMVKLNEAESVLLALVVTTFDSGEAEERFFIYNGKAYPKEVDELKMKAYVKMILNQNR